MECARAGAVARVVSEQRGAQQPIRVDQHGFTTHGVEEEARLREEESSGRATRAAIEVVMDRERAICDREADSYVLESKGKNARVRRRLQRFAHALRRTDAEHAALVKVGKKHASLFFEKPELRKSLGTIAGVYLTIPVLPATDERRARKYVWRSLNNERMLVAHRFTTELLRLGRIGAYPAAEWGPPRFLAHVLLVRKSSGGWRYVVAFLDVNAATVPDPRVTDSADEVYRDLSDFLLYFSSDAVSAYWAVQIAEESRRHTAFHVAGLGVFYWKYACMGLSYSGNALAEAMEKILASDPTLGRDVRRYFDDIAAGSSSAERHAVLLERLLGAFAPSGFNFGLPKTSFAVPEIKLLGRLVSRRGVRNDPKLTRALTGAPLPTSFAELRSEVQALNWLGRELVPSFAELAEPVYAALRGTAAHNKDLAAAGLPPLATTRRSFTEAFGEGEREALLALRRACASDHVIIHFDAARPVVVLTDASGTGAGGMLAQFDAQERLRPIALWSRALSRPQQAWGAYQREAFSWFSLVKKFGPRYLSSSYHYAVLDHQTLQFLNGSADLEHRAAQGDQVARWKLVLSQYASFVVPTPGASHLVADWLSRAHLDKQCLAADGTSDAVSPEPAHEFPVAGTVAPFPTAATAVVPFDAPLEEAKRLTGAVDFAPVESPVTTGSDSPVKVEQRRVAAARAADADGVFFGAMSDDAPPHEHMASWAWPDGVLAGGIAAPARRAVTANSDDPLVHAIIAVGIARAQELAKEHKVNITVRTATGSGQRMSLPDLAAAMAASPAAGAFRTALEMDVPPSSRPVRAAAAGGVATPSRERSSGGSAPAPSSASPSDGPDSTSAAAAAAAGGSGKDEAADDAVHSSRVLSEGDLFASDSRGTVARRILRGEAGSPLTAWAAPGSSERRELARAQSTDSETTAFVREHPELVRRDDGLVYRAVFDSDGDETGRVVVVPRSHVRLAAELSHDHIASGAHLGAEKSVARAKTRFWWPSLANDVASHAKECATCARFRVLRKQPPGEDAPVVLHHACEQLELDVAQYTPTDRGHTHVLMVMDPLTSRVHAEAVKSTDAATLAWALAKALSVFGTWPSSFATDGGSTVIAPAIRQLAQLAGSSFHVAALGNAQAIGSVERQNGVFKSILRPYLDDFGSDWDVFLPLAIIAANCMINYGSCAYTRDTGRVPRFLDDGVWGGARPNTVDTVTLGTLSVSRARIRDSVTSATRTLRQAERKARSVRSESQVRVGGRAFLYLPFRAPGTNRKLCASWEGPFVVTRRIGTDTYGVHIGDDASNDSELVVNGRRLAPADSHTDISVAPDERVEDSSRPAADSEATRRAAGPDSGADYELSYIFDHHPRASDPLEAKSYHARFVGYHSRRHDRWFDVEHLDNARQLIDEYVVREAERDAGAPAESADQRRARHAKRAMSSAVHG